MAKRFTKYNSGWENNFKWIKSVKNDDSMARCEFCVKSFRIDNAGIAQVSKTLNLTYLVL